MRCKNLLIKISVVALLLIGAGTASAQLVQLRGKVVMAQEDGTTVPLAGATIDVFRTDIAGKWETKTDKGGGFVFAGLPFVGTYLISVSAPNARPEATSGVRLGNLPDGELPQPVTLVAGDGKRLTLEEAKAVSTGPARPTETAGDKAKRAEDARKAAEVDAANKRNLNINEVLNRTFKAGRDAIAAKNYDEAIKQFDEGLAADPSQVVLYAQKATALRKRGVDHFNASVKSTDAAIRTAEFESAKKDFQAAAAEASKGVEAAKKEAPATDPAGVSGQTLRKVEAFGERAESMRLFAKVDPIQADTGVIAYQEYMAIETDAAKKAAAQLLLAQMLLDAGSADKAIVEFQKILDVDPDNVDALYGMGVAQINIGYAANDKAKLQEAVNYLQRFVDKAPDTNRYKLEAKAAIEEMKKQQNVVPEKAPTTPRRKRP